MPIARYWRIAVGSQGVPTETEVSAITLINTDTVFDMTAAAAVVTTSFVPVSGDPSILMRSAPVGNECLVIPSSSGARYITFDLKTAVNINAFRIGFGSNELKSMTKLSLQYSTTNLLWTTLYSIEDAVKLNYTAPYTLSELSSSNTGYPSLFQQKEIVSYDTPSNSPGTMLVDTLERRVFSYNGSKLPSDASTVGSSFFLPLSGWMKPGKYYFELSVQTKVNQSLANSLYFGIGYRKSTVEYRMDPKNSLLFALTQTLNGSNKATYVLDPKTSLGLESPAGFNIVEGGKSGYQGSFLLDSILKKIELKNSPYIGNLEFTHAKSFNATVATTDSLFFFLTSPLLSDTREIDYTFNFGQKPWVNEPPAGFESRIGYRWNLVVDNLWISKQKTRMKDLVENPAVRCNPLDFGDEYFPSNSFKDVLIEEKQKYFIKGFVSSQDNAQRKHLVKLMSYPELILLEETVSNSQTGLYEFINIEYREYAIVSCDLLNKDYSPEIIAPVFPLLMEAPIETP